MKDSLLDDPDFYRAEGMPEQPATEAEPEPISQIIDSQPKPESCFPTLGESTHAPASPEAVTAYLERQKAEEEATEAEPVTAADILKTYDQEIHYISNNKGVGNYLMRKPDGRYLPLKEGALKKHLRRAGVPYEKTENGLSYMDNLLYDIQLDSSLDYAGRIAGFDAGIHEVDGLRFLSLRSPVTPTVKVGKKESSATLEAVLEGIFPDDENLNRFKAWLYYSWKSLSVRKWAPLPVLALAGPRNCGKTLLIDLLAYILGGTEAGKAYRYLRGETGFNADLCGSHLLVVDDEVSSTDMRSRRAVGQQIKGVAVTSTKRIEPKGFDAVNLPVHWRLVIASNDEAEHLQVLPPLDDGMRDKLLLLRCQRAKMPMPSATPEQRARFMAKLKSEIPFLLCEIAYSSWIDKYGDSRQSVTGWQDPELFDALASLNAEEQLLDLIDTLEPWGCGLSWTGTSAKLEGLLTDYQSSTAHKAKQLLSWPKACGLYLGRLADSHSDRVERDGPVRNYEWRIKAS